MAVEFRPVRCSIDAETGLFWVDDSLNYPRLICEASTISPHPPDDALTCDFGTSLHSSQTCPRRSGLANNHELTQSCLQSAFIRRLSV